MILFLITNWKGLVLGVVAGAAVMLAYCAFTMIPAARQQGQMGERIEWQEKQRRAEIKADADKAAAQATIDKIEADSLQQAVQREAQHTVEMSALDQALQEAQSNASFLAPGAACRAVIPRGVLDHLDGIGRATPRFDPAVPNARVP